MPEFNDSNNLISDARTEINIQPRGRKQIHITGSVWYFEFYSGKRSLSALKIGWYGVDAGKGIGIFRNIAAEKPLAAIGFDISGC